MEDLHYYLIEFMQEDFGDLGPVFLARELKSLGFENVVSLSPEERNVFMEHILTHVFSQVMSPQKVAIKKSRLQSLLEKFPPQCFLSSREKTTILLRGIPANEPGISRTDFPSISRIFSVILGGGLLILVLVIALMFKSEEKVSVNITNNSLINWTHDFPSENFSQETMPDLQNTSLNMTENSSNNQNATANNNIPNATNQNSQNLSSQNNTMQNLSQQNNTLQNNSLNNNTLQNNTQSNQNTTIPQNNTQQNNNQNITDNNQTSIDNTSDYPPGNDTIQNNTSDNYANNTYQNTTCNSAKKGTIQFDETNGHFYGCDGTVWKQLDN
ncbi:hypothetical protein C4573_03080 [Candidatus Woesearchaeota archaeon]|nr:MAG: hypothetical protein C4573_03080 [Candidatus Woesearchaeota archaeon]